MCRGTKQLLEYKKTIQVTSYRLGINGSRLHWIEKDSALLFKIYIRRRM